jgi:hypothetical protein
LSKNYLLAPFFYLALIVIGLGLSGIGSVVLEMSKQFGVSSAVMGQGFPFHGLGYLFPLWFAGFLGDNIQKSLLLRLGLVN